MKKAGCPVRVAGVVFVWFLGYTAALAADRGEDGTIAAVVDYLSVQRVSEDVRTAMLKTVQQNSAESSWSGQSNDALFAIAVRRLPKGEIRQRALPGMLRLTHAVAISKLLETKAALNVYEAEGLTDAAALRIAVGRASERLDFSGFVQGVLHQTTAQDDFAVGYVVADIAKVTAHLRRPALLMEVKDAYRDTIHEQMQKSMKQNQWPVAYESWEHLHKLDLTSEVIYVDAAQCLIELDRQDEAMQNVREFLKKFQSTAKSGTLEKLGDLLLNINTPAAQETAKLAYRAASDRLRSFRGDGKIER